MWVLYFDQIDYDRFGTIREQFWAILHYPLHVAILLTVEGSTTLILWNIIVRYDSYWWNLFGGLPTFYNSDIDVIDSIKEAIEKLNKKFKADNLTQESDYYQNLTSIAEPVVNLTDWKDQDNDPVLNLWVEIETVIFAKLGIQPTNQTESTNQKDSADFTVIVTALTQGWRLSVRTVPGPPVRYRTPLHPYLVSPVLPN